MQPQTFMLLRPYALFTLNMNLNPAKKDASSVVFTVIDGFVLIYLTIRHCDKYLISFIWHSIQPEGMCLSSVGCVARNCHLPSIFLSFRVLIILFLNVTTYPHPFPSPPPFKAPTTSVFQGMASNVGVRRR